MADEQENMIDRYLENGTMYVLEDNGVKAECVVTDLIKRTAACGKTSKMAIYKALKAHFKYETIGKMPCHQFDEAEKILNDTKQRFCP